MRDALHPAHPRRQAGHAARRRRQSRSRKNPRLHDAAREGGRPQRALDRHRHHRGGGVGRASPRSPASRCIGCWPSASTAARVADKVFCYVGGGWYWPGQTIRDLQDEMRRHLDAGYTMVKMKVGGLPLADDVQARRGGEEHPAAACASSRSTPIASSTATRRSPMPGRSRRSSCAGSRSPAIRSTSRCWRRSPASMTARSRPARTCSRPRTSRTWCASAACSPSAAT